MQFGLHIGLRGPAGQPGPLSRIARRAEAAGYGHLGVSDHVAIARAPGTTYPYTKDGRWFAEDTGECLEQVTVVGFLAAATERIRLLTSVMVLGHRPPLLAAKMLATADVLSGGRLTLGVGVGWLREEFALLDAPDFDRRGAVANETLEAFRNLWTEPAPAYAGEHVAFDNLLFSPKPAQKPHPPIWVGGESPAARRRAGRLGDAWYPLGNHPRWRFNTPERYAAGLAQVREIAEEAGRPPPAGSLYAMWIMPGETVFDGEGNRRPFTGDRAAVRDDFAAFAEAGLDTLIVGYESPDEDTCIRRLEAFAELAWR